MSLSVIRRLKIDQTDHCYWVKKYWFTYFSFILLICMVKSYKNNSVDLFFNWKVLLWYMQENQEREGIGTTYSRVSTRKRREEKVIAVLSRLEWKMWKTILIIMLNLKSLLRFYVDNEQSLHYFHRESSSTGMSCFLTGLVFPEGFCQVKSADININKEEILQLHVLPQLWVSLKLKVLMQFPLLLRDHQHLLQHHQIWFLPAPHLQVHVVLQLRNHLKLKVLLQPPLLLHDHQHLLQHHFIWLLPAPHLQLCSLL